MGNERKRWHLKHSTFFVCSVGIAIVLCSVFVATLLAHVSWTSSDSMVTVEFGAGRAYLCLREPFPGVAVPSAGWAFQWRLSWPNLGWRVIGYPGSSWFVLPLLAPLLVTGVGYVVIAMVRAKMRRQAHVCLCCGYDLRRLRSSVCPECGTGIKSGC